MTTHNISLIQQFHFQRRIVYPFSVALFLSPFRMKKFSTLFLAGSLALSFSATALASPSTAPGQQCTGLIGMSKTRCMRGAVSAMQMMKKETKKQSVMQNVRKHYKRTVVQQERDRQEMHRWKSSVSSVSSSSVSSSASTSSAASSTSSTSSSGAGY